MKTVDYATGLLSKTLVLKKSSTKEPYTYPSAHKNLAPVADVVDSARFVSSGYLLICF